MYEGVRTIEILDFESISIENRLLHGFHDCQEGGGAVLEDFKLFEIERSLSIN